MWPSLGGGGFDYVQNTAPQAPETGETWYDTGVDEAKVYTSSGAWHVMSTQLHSELGGVGSGDHHSYPIPTSGIEDAAVTALKLAFDPATQTELNDHASSRTAHQGLPPIYGDGRDGAISRGANGNENGIINATTYTVQAGVTRNVTNGVLVVRATDRITVNGHLNADGYGASGGTGGTDGAPGNPGGDGTAGDWVGTFGAGGTNNSAGTDGGGGGGGDAGLQSGGSGGDSLDDSFTGNAVNRAVPYTSVWEDVWDLVISAPGSGGGGGGGGASDGDPGGHGGDGGAGGGLIVLMAPTIDGSGTISARGAPGGAGGDGSGTYGGGGGGGGGGDGGMLAIFANSMEFTGTQTVAGGAGGAGGTGGSSGNNGGAGGDGVAGIIIQP